MVEEYEKKKADGAIDMRPSLNGVLILEKRFDTLSGREYFENRGETNEKHLNDLIEERERTIKEAEANLETLRAGVTNLQAIKADVAAFMSPEEDEKRNG